MNIEMVGWGLEELSDRALQEKLWLGKSEGEMSSFIEAICATFDDSGLGDALSSPSNKYGLSDVVREKANILRGLIQQVPQTGNPQEIIQNPKMENVRRAAAELLELIQK
jgi:hypothetical protein